LRFGPIKREVGFPQQVIRILPVKRANRDPNARADMEIVAVQVKGLAEHSDHFLRSRRSTTGIIQFGQDQGKLIAPQSRGWVRLPHTGAQSLGRLLQQPITSGMTQAVVHVLEVIEVNQQHGQLPAIAVCAAQRLGQMVAEESTIGETG
jgi:hypothetical protein